MKVITSIRMACAMSIMSLFFMSSVSCKKDNGTSNSPLVGSWLLYQSGEDDNQNGKLEDSEWITFTKNEYDILKTFGITGEIVFNSDGTGKIVAIQGDADIFKWTTKADGTFEIRDADPNAGIFTPIEVGDTEKFYIDAKGDLSYEAVRKFNTIGVISTVAAGNRFKRN
jgi:hypothetical protein